tara:strand:- start:3010 stop:3795 length:786 start_codon:yes stop_codon:yes gene_type:complete
MIKNEELLRTYAPAAFATEPEKDRVSDRYSFLPTTDILEILQDEGWTPWSARQVNTRTWSKDHAKHIIRLKHEDLDMKSFGVGDSFPEMLLMNAHNGLGSYDLMGGIFRMVCSNGMVVSDSDFGKIHIRHIGFEPQQVKEASTELVMNASRISDKINKWREIELTPTARKDFFADAARLRFGENTSADLVEEVSRFRRPEDNKKDLWTTFNVAQENIIRGGFRNTNTRRMVRAISNIQKDINLNSDLWDLTSKYSERISLN